MDIVKRTLGRVVCWIAQDHDWRQHQEVLPLDVPLIDWQALQGYSQSLAYDALQMTMNPAMKVRPFMRCHRCLAEARWGD